MNKYSFQNCQKLVIFSEDESSVLLCKRKGEQDYDGVYTFIGGKMETTDSSMIEGMRREKEEEIGNKCKVILYPTFSHLRLYKKKDGNYLLLPHYYAVYKGGEVLINDEYSDFVWVKITELISFEPKIDNIPEIVDMLLRLKPLMRQEEFVAL